MQEEEEQLMEERKKRKEDKKKKEAAQKKVCWALKKSACGLLLFITGEYCYICCYTSVFFLISVFTICVYCQLCNGD